MLNASIQSGALGGILSSYRWLATFHRHVVLGAARYFRPKKGKQNLPMIAFVQFVTSYISFHLNSIGEGKSIFILPWALKL